jgi:hypothetical protein
MKCSKFESIEFTTNNDRGGESGRFVKGVWVPKREFSLMWSRATSLAPSVGNASPLTAKTVFADKSWEAFPLGKRIALGRVLLYFVEQGMLPLRLVNSGKKGPRRYVRTTPFISEAHPAAISAGPDAAYNKSTKENS